MKQFTWIPFYGELADKLMQFRHDRGKLLSLIYKHRKELSANYLHDKNGKDDIMEDIDPFTVFGLFNRQIHNKYRLQSTKLLKELLGIQADAPKDFFGIPVLNNMKSHFFGFRDIRKSGDIENLWILFEKAIKGEELDEIFDKVTRQYGININITMALFWIRPKDYLAFDSTNRNYLAKAYGITITDRVPDSKEYRRVINDIKENIENGKIKEKTFWEVSANANKFVYGDGVSGKNIHDDYLNEDRFSFYTKLWRKKQNIVLQGAPGTGKTYSVPELVVRLCEPDFEAENKNRKELMAVYDRLKEEKRIMFTTFHQSMDYEDWLESLRPEVDENQQVKYKIESGIFKKLCEEAERPIEKEGINLSEDATVWKVSLCRTGDNPIRRDCMENGYIRIGWDGYGENITEETDWTIHNGEGKAILNAFMNIMTVGDIIMSCFSNRTIDAIGIVTGDYEWREEWDEYKRVRRVKWLVKDIEEDIVELNEDKKMTLSAVYRLNSITVDKVKKLLDKHESSKTLPDNKKAYVIVIDEFNRGNVSKIFGELITLLESDKRFGKENAESVLLPYSKKSFYVPSNVFVIATMNTADRSLDTIDYAIRRRFAFVTVKPREIDDENFNAGLFREVSELFISNYDEYAGSGFDDTMKLLPAETLSEEYRPEDVWLGHSYFIMERKDIQNRLLFEIIPLLEEYMRNGILTEEAQDTVDKLRSIAKGQ